MKEQGRVKWFRTDKGYGFITPDTGTPDLFVHYSGIEGEGFKTLENADRVAFERAEGEKGEQAVAVDILTTKPEKAS